MIPTRCAGADCAETRLPVESISQALAPIGRVFSFPPLQDVRVGANHRQRPRLNRGLGQFSLSPFYNC